LLYPFTVSNNYFLSHTHIYKNLTGIDMITIHHLEYSQSFRVLWLFEELGVDYNLKLYERDPVTRLAPAAYKKISPLGTAPVISHGDVVLAESNAIMDYVLDLHPSKTLRPEPGSPDRVRFLFWYHAAQGSMMPIMLIDAILGMVEKRSPFFVRAILKPIFKMTRANFSEPRLKALLDQAENDLATAPYFGGENLTIADIVLSYPMESMHERGMLAKRYPNCAAWVQRMHESPGFKRAVEKDGKSSIAFSG
jgi:glutathione S-transferase